MCVKYSRPEKRIFDNSDLAYFQKSLAYKQLHHVIATILLKVNATPVPKGWLSASIVTRNQPRITGLSPETDTNTRSEIKISPSVEKVVQILDKFNNTIDTTPPRLGPRRFGNLACRDWHAKIEDNASAYLKELLSDSGLNEELEYYLLNSFGSAVRLDYGSGHELSFVAFIGGLMECGIIDKEVLGTELLAVFARYYDVSRRLITVYNLEPAGSHGVWGLDDHFHFIYILGAAEFNFPDDQRGSLYVPPVLQVLSSHTIDSFKESNLYVNAIAFIYKIKLGPFHEHSPIIYDIHHSVSLWAKVLSGLVKMYEVEVLGKAPVVQHFWFGSGLYAWKDANTLADLPVRQFDQDDGTSVTEDEIPGLINGFAGTKTTRSNITLTGAPWARKTTPVPPKKTTVPARRHP